VEDILLGLVMKHRSLSFGKGVGRIGLMIMIPT
jgi:hypothetical protein